MSLWSKISALPSEVWEKVAAIPPLTVLVTSLTRTVDWQKSFYVISTIWVLLQIYFRLRKEYAKWKARQILDPDDTGYKPPL